MLEDYLQQIEELLSTSPVVRDVAEVEARGSLDNEE
jgi:hypothetical protein